MAVYTKLTTHLGLFRNREVGMKSFNEIGAFYGTDKADISLHGHFAGNPGHNYMRYYERMLGTYRADELTIVEIGVQYGYSLQAWDEIFPNANVHGIDKSPLCAQEHMTRAKLHTFDATNLEECTAFFTKLGPVDVLIEDASHQSQEQVNLFHALFRYVRSGGFYVIEDIGCGYQEYYGGGPDGGVTIQMVRSFIDDIHNGCSKSKITDIAGVHLFRDIAFVEKA